MGPQKAVVVAVNTPVHKRIAIRVRLIRIPKLAAYISPNNKAFKGLISKIANNSPINAQVPRMVIVQGYTGKITKPHITNACTRSVDDE